MEWISGRNPGENDLRTDKPAGQAVRGDFFLTWDGEAVDMDFFETRPADANPHADQSGGFWHRPGVLAWCRLPAPPGNPVDREAGRQGGSRLPATQGESLQASVLDALASHIAVLDSEGRIVAVNRAWTDFGRGNGGALEGHAEGASYLDVLRASASRGNASAGHALEGLVAVLRGDSAHYELEYPCHGPADERWFLMQVFPLPATGGGVVSHLNITKRKKAEQAHARLAAILEATTDFVGIADEAGRELYANRAFRQIRGRGLSPEDPLGTIANNHPEWAYRAIRDVGLPEALRSGVWAGEIAVLDPAGREVPVHQVILAHRGDDGGIEFFSTIMRDISASKEQSAALERAFEELKRAQEQLVQSEKMASIGQLAAGVAHEINNPIGFLHSNLHTLGRYVDDVMRVVTAFERVQPGAPDPAIWSNVNQVRQEVDFPFVREDIPQLLSESMDGIQRVRKIVQDLKDFAHAGDSDDWQWADLRHGLTRTLNIVHNELKYKAEVFRDFEELPEVRCLPSQLNQVFMNLLVNAAHAIEAKGQVRVGARQQGQHVVVEISDTGSGMSPEVAGRIFEPFFTTKPVGKGTGLGLSISYGIVKKHGGRIELDSEVGRGSTFRVVLPVNGPEGGAA